MISAASLRAAAHYHSRLAGSAKHAPAPLSRRCASVSLSSSSHSAAMPEGGEDAGRAMLLAQLEARVAELHKTAQEVNRQPGRTEEATALYRQLAALDDQALALRLERPRRPTLGEVAQHAAHFPAYATPPPRLPSWASAAEAARRLAESAGSQHTGATPGQLRQRAAGAVLGGGLADAAACGVQWVYDLSRLEELAAARPGGHLEFYEPPQCPFFSYPPGSASPYGEQTAVLLRSLVEAGGLDCCHYAHALHAALGPGFEGYRDRSTKAFLRRYADGALPPLTGAPDDQANAFTRLPPLVALLTGGGRPELLGAVERMVRTTQDDDIAVAYGCVAALILESVVLGSTVTGAVTATVAWLQAQAAQQVGTTASSAACFDPAAIPAELWAHVAAQLVRAAELAPRTPAEATALLGRNCHLPQSLTTPLHVLLHLEHWRQQGQQGQSGAEEAAVGPREAAGTAGAGRQQAGSGASQQADAVDFCLPCSMGEGGDGACELPVSGGSSPAGTQAAARQEHWPAELSTEDYMEAVRLAIRQGGCCASRATYVGALAGALAGAGGLPPAWAAKMTTHADEQRWTGRLLGLRDQ